MVGYLFRHVISREEKSFMEKFRKDWDRFTDREERNIREQRKSLDSGSLTRLIAMDDDPDRKAMFFRTRDKVEKGESLTELESSYLPLLVSPLFFRERGISAAELHEEVRDLLKSVHARKDDMRLIMSMVFYEFIRTSAPVPESLLSYLVKEVPEVRVLLISDAAACYCDDGDTERFSDVLSFAGMEHFSPLMRRFLPLYFGRYPMRGSENPRLVPTDGLSCPYREKVECYGVSSLISGRVGHRTGSLADPGTPMEEAAWSALYRALSPSPFALVNVPGTVLGGSMLEPEHVLSGMTRFLDIASRLISDAVFTWKTGSFPARSTWPYDEEKRMRSFLPGFFSDIGVRLLLPERKEASDCLDWVNIAEDVKILKRNDGRDMPLVMFPADHEAWSCIRSRVPDMKEDAEHIDEWYEILRKGKLPPSELLSKCLPHVIYGLRCRDDARSLIADLENLARPYLKKYLRKELSSREKSAYELIASVIRGLHALWRIPADLDTLIITRECIGEYDRMLSHSPEVPWKDEFILLILANGCAECGSPYLDTSSTDWKMLMKGIGYARENMSAKSILDTVHAAWTALENANGRLAITGSASFRENGVAELVDFFNSELWEDRAEISDGLLDEDAEPFTDDELIQPLGERISVKTVRDPRIIEGFAARLSKLGNGCSSSSRRKRNACLDWRNGLIDDDEKSLEAYASWRKDFLSSGYTAVPQDESFKYVLFEELTHASRKKSTAMTRAFLDLSIYDHQLADACWKFLLASDLPVPTELGRYLSSDCEKLFDRILVMNRFGSGKLDIRVFGEFAGTDLVSFHQEAMDLVFPEIWKALHGENITSSLVSDSDTKPARLLFDFPASSLGKAEMTVEVPFYKDLEDMRKRVVRLWTAVHETLYDIVNGGYPHPSTGLTERECYIIRKTVWETLFLDEERRKELFPARKIGENETWPFSLLQREKGRNGLRALPVKYFISPLELRSSHDASLTSIVGIAARDGFMDSSLIASSGLAGCIGRASLTLGDDEELSAAVAEAYYRPEKYSTRITEKQHDLFCDALLAALGSDPEYLKRLESGKKWQEMRYTYGRIPGTRIEGWYLPFTAEPDENITKAADNAVRKLSGNSLLKTSARSSARYDAIGKALEKWVKSGGRTGTVRKNISISRDALDLIRKDSESVREALRTEDDDVEEITPSAPENVSDCPTPELTELEKRILALLLEGRTDEASAYAEEEFSSLDIVSDGINDKAQDLFQMFFLDEECEVLPDAMDTIKEIVSE